VVINERTWANLCRWSDTVGIPTPARGNEKKMGFLGILLPPLARDQLEITRIAFTTKNFIFDHL
jgi:hypothetical protein